MHCAYNGNDAVVWLYGPLVCKAAVSARATLLDTIEAVMPWLQQFADCQWTGRSVEGKRAALQLG